MNDAASGQGMNDLTDQYIRINGAEVELLIAMSLPKLLYEITCVGVPNR